MISDKLSHVVRAGKSGTFRTVATAEKTDGRRNQTRARLLDEALRLLLQDGYEQATTGRIASAAGIRQSSFYSHFPSREACLAEAVTREALTLVDRLAARRRGLRGLPLSARGSREASDAGFRVALSHLSAHPELCALIAMREADHAAGAAVRAALEKLRDGLVADLDVFGTAPSADAAMRVDLMMALTWQASIGVRAGLYPFEAAVAMLTDQTLAMFPRLTDATARR